MRLIRFALLSLAFCACADDELASAIGELHLELCDRGAACGCEVLGLADGVIDFGSPGAGAVSQRTLLIKNDNQPRVLTVEQLLIEDATGSFSIAAVRRRSGPNADATVAAHDMASGPLVLEGSEEGEVVLAFSPQSALGLAGSLVVLSSSGTRPSWRLSLLGGGGSSTVSAGALAACGTACALDFGTYQDEQVGPDLADPAGRPLALGAESIVVANTGASDIFVTVELTDDGIPERPGELVGTSGVFFLGEVGCSVVPAGGSLAVPVEYRPSTAGEHSGEVALGGLGATVHVALSGRVVGAHICFRTEDDVPEDAELTFGSAPTYEVAENGSETRRIFVESCGFQEDLVISAVSPAAGSSAEFGSPALPWSSTGPLAPGAAVEMPITFTPASAPGASPTGRMIFSTNDGLRPTAAVDLRARVGIPESCALVASPNPVDFGWVASDEEGLGTSCPPFFPCSGADMISRARSITLLNAGRRTCGNISFDDIITNSGSTGMFSIRANPNPAGFSLAPGASSQPIALLFARETGATAQNHFGRLPYRSPDMPIAPVNIELAARGGGSPDCLLTFQPVQAPNALCPNDTLAFGNVNLGDARTITLKIINTGSASCTLTDVTRGGNATVFEWLEPTLPLVLAPNDFVTMPVTFTPVPPSGSMWEEMPFGCGFSAFPGFGGASSLIFDYYSGASGPSQERTLDLSGKGTRPDINVIPSEVDFGDVTIGCCSAPQRIAIYNSGTGTLTIHGVSVQTSSDAGFSNTQPADTSLTAGESTELTARFCASAEGAHSGLLLIDSSDDNEESFTVSLTGYGTTDSSGNDAFQQPARPMVDVLWVVDDSGSMSEEQTNLANNFDTFISRAVELDTDYHLGVVNTEVETEWGGRLYSCNNPLWISDTQTPAEQQDQFRCNVRTSDSGRPSSDSKEAALQAARLAFDHPNIDEWNAGFYREAAKLYVIMVTDEEDQSDGPAQMYVDFFQNLKGLANPDLLNISAISGQPPDGCDTAAANPKGYEAVQLVGGQFRSICAADWTDLIASLGLDVFNARRQFPLSRPATASTIAVEVCDDTGGTPTNCAPVAQSATDGWSFDAATNSVLFNGTSVPRPGQHVRVTYIAVCYSP